jgi:hypothetical protein
VPAWTFPDVQESHASFPRIPSSADVFLAALPLLCAGAFGATPAVPAPVQKPATRATEPNAVAAILKRAEFDGRFIR